MGSLAAGTLATGAMSTAAAVAGRHRGAGAIDVHAHYVTPTYRAALIAAGQSRPDGMPGIPDWSVEQALRFMDANRIATAMLSVSSPGISLGDTAANRDLARTVNKEGAAIVHAHPARFGLLASVPLPDVPAAVSEVEFALDDLGADGIILETNYQGTYVGSPAFEPLMAALHRRKAVVLLHPTSPACSQSTSLGYPRPMIEFLFDTTRAVTELVLNRVVDRYPGIEFIIPHSGATLPVVADRISAFALAAGGPPADVLGALGRLHYDVAGFPLPRALPALLDLVDPDRLLYGSDYPFTPAPSASAQAKALAETRVLRTPDKQALFHGNARRLFPRLK
ncbi:amidohydrolase family protein [Streptomyces sp. B93]|uniref:amidohydrolase family protein n=1 Tax=Streptomyces sp. B93 TaxID=2824875 RepID=UPI001FFC3FA0|nr:amidohydrolase family protein [Streptomyces sp. B93]